LGLLGGALAPYLEKVTDWIAANKELIQQKTKEWVDKIRRAVLFLAPKIAWLADKLGSLIKWLDKTITSMGGMENVLKIVAIFLGSSMFLKGILMIRKLGIAGMWANAKLLLIPLAITALVLIFEDLYRFLEGDKSVIGGLVKAAGVSDVTVAQIREGWAALKEDLSLWGDGIGKTMSAFWTEIGNGFDQLVVQPIKKGIDEIIKDLKKIPLVGLLTGETTTGSSEGSRSETFGFGGKNRNDPAGDFDRISRDPRIGNREAIRRQSDPLLIGLAKWAKTNPAKGPQIKVNVNVKSNADPEQIARAAERAVGGAMSQAKRANATGVDY